MVGARRSRAFGTRYDARLRRDRAAPTIGAVKLSQLSAPVLETWRDSLLKGTKDHPAVSRRLARKVLGTLKSILSEAQRRGLVAQNAALPVKITTKKRDVKQLEVGADVSRHHRCAKAAGDRRRAPLVVASAVAGHRRLYRDARFGAARADLECDRF